MINELDNFLIQLHNYCEYIKHKYLSKNVKRRLEQKKKI